MPEGFAFYQSAALMIPRIMETTIMTARTMMIL